MKHLRPIEEKKPKGAPDWHDSDAPDANGRFRDLSIKDLAAWLIKTRKKDVKRISGSLTQQIVFNRNDDPKYAEKMEKTRKEVYKQLGREDLLESVDKDDLKNAKEKLSNPHTILDITYSITRRGDRFVRFDYENKYVPGKMVDSGPHFVKVFYGNDKDLKKISKELNMDLKESTIDERKEYVGRYNTVKKVIAKIGRRPSEQEVATFITNNYYDVTGVERGWDDPQANDKIADLVAFYKFDIDDWNIAWTDAQNESLVTEASTDRMIKQIKRALKDGLSIFKLPMATQKYYAKNKSDFETVEEGNYKMEDIYDLIAHHRFDKDFKKLSSKDKEWVENDAKERGFNESLLESDMFNMYYSLIDELYEAKPGPDAYMTGLSDEEKEEKKAKMKKQADMDDDDPDSYEELPGDEEAREKGKVKKSKHTTAYNKKFKSESMKNLKSFDNFVTEKRSDLWSPFQKADILAGDMFGAMGLYRLEDDELDQIIDLKKADKLAKKMFGEFGFKTLAAKEMEDLLDNNPDLLRESKEDFKPHMMYDPKTGKGYKAETQEDHEKMNKLGYVHEKPEEVTEAEKYITGEFKVGDKIKTNFGEWEVIEIDYKPGKSFIAPFIFKGKDMKRVNIPNPPKTNKKAVGYKVTDGAKYPTIGFLYQYKDITKLATVGVDESLVNEKETLASAIEKEMDDNRFNVDVEFFTRDLRQIQNTKNHEDLHPSIKKVLKALKKKYKIKESVVNEEKIKYAKGKTYQSSGHWTVMVDSNSSMCDIRVNHSAGWRLDPHDDREETWELLDNGRQRATLYFRRGNIDKFAQQMFDLNDETTWGNKTKLTAKDYADIIRLWIDMKKANESIVEASLAKIHRAAKKGSYPVSLVVIENGKVVKQELVGTPQIVPAAFNQLKKEYPNATVHVESKTGERLFSESVVENRMLRKGQFRFGAKLQYGIEDVNESYGFYGTLMNQFGLDEVNQLFLDGFSLLGTQYDFTDQAALYYLNSKAGRWVADQVNDKLVGPKNMAPYYGHLEEIFAEYAKKGQWRKWAKEYDQFAEEDNMEEGLMIRESKSDMDEYYRGLLEAEQTTNDQSPLGDDGMETGIKNKAKESGVPVGLLRIIMRRGLAAWKTGHRPGATQAQWGYARVNSFLTKQPGTWGKADSDIAKKVRDGGHDKDL